MPATGSPARSTRCSADRAAVGPDHEPEPTELEHVVAEHAAGRVVDVVVERPAAVRHLALSAAPPDRSEVTGAHAPARDGAAAREHRRPRRGAGAVALAAA